MPGNLLAAADVLLLLFRLPPAAWEVELKELVNPSLVKVSDSSSSGRDLTCAPDGCIGVLTRVSASKKYMLRAIATVDYSESCCVCSSHEDVRPF